jgi:hypothetical protein
MAEYQVSLTPDVIKIDSEGSLDTSLLDGKSIQRTMNFLMITNGEDRKIVGQLQDGETTDDVIQTITDVESLEVGNQVFILTKSSLVDYTETVDEEGYEPNNLIAVMEQNSISYTKLSDTTESLFTSLKPSDVLIFPELENGDPVSLIAEESKTAINNFVSTGGTFVVFTDYNSYMEGFLNDVFEFSVEQIGGEGVGNPISITAEGTALLPMASVTLANNDATFALNATTFPEGSVIIYEGGNANEAVVTMIPYVDGKIYVLGWDWYDAQPIGTQDGGWNDLLVDIIS